MKCKCLLYIMLQLLACGSIAQTRFTDGDVYYITTSDTTVAVTHPETGSYSVSGLFIPEEATNNGTVYSVTSIADSAFMNSSLNYLDIPATVSRIGRKAFWGLFENSTDTGAIVMRSVHPPTLSDVPFTGFCCFIYITCSSYSFYENATGNWIPISETNRFRGLEGDIERVIDTTVCVGPNVFELYNPYHDSTIYLYRNIIQHSTFTYIDMMIPIQGCRVTSRLLVDVLPDGSYNEVMLYLCSQNNNEVSFRLDQHNFDTILTTVGNHEFRFPDGDCDDIYHVTVVNTDATLGIENINLCDGDAYYHMDENSMFVSIEQDSIYYKHMSMNGRGGCDSIVQVNIDFHPLPDIRDTIHKCQGQRYLWSREGYNENNQFIRLSSYCDSAGVYVDTTLRSEWGCPMSHTLNLFIHTDPQVHIYDTICYNGRNYNNHGFYIPQYLIAPNRLQTIDRTNNNRSIYGCDSTTYLHLTVLPTQSTNLGDVNLCRDSVYTFNNRTITTSGTYRDTLSTTMGCDSVVSINVILRNNNSSTFTQNICQGSSYTWNISGYDENGNNTSHTQTLTESGIYTDSTLKTQYGCANFHRLILTVNPVYNDTIRDTICYGNTYNENGFHIPISQTTNVLQTISRVNNRVTSKNCDSITTLLLTIKPTASLHIYDTIIEGESLTYNNVTYTDSGTYIHTFGSANGCDSVVFLNLMVHRHVNTFIYDSICQGETYNENGFSESTSGTFVQNLHTSHGSDSTVTLYLVVNPTYNDTIFDTICRGETYNQYGFVQDTAGITTRRLQTANRCDSIVTLHLTVNPRYDTLINTEIVEGQQYDFNGVLIAETGIYYDTLQAANGCDSSFVLNLVVWPSVNTVFYDSICQGETYNENGFSESTSGTFVQNLHTSHGSDSTVTLYLVVNPTYNDTIFDTICRGETYNQYGFVQDTAGITTRRLQTTNGCDSIVTLHLTVNPRYDTLINTEIVEGQQYDFNGVLIAETGIYYDTLQAANGCDSSFVLNLVVWPSVNTVFYDSICQGETYNENGFSESTSGTFVQNLHTSHGSDSTVTLYLVVNPTYNDTIFDTICQGETYNQYGFVQDTVGITTRRLQTTNGCDSIVTLHLTVNPVYDTLLFAEICRGETYMFHSRSLSESGIYVDTLATHLGCDSIVRLSLTIHPVFDTLIVDSVCYGSSYTLNGFDESEAGTYTQYLTTVNGCDSIVRLRLSLMKYIDTIYADICDGESYTSNNFDKNTTGIYIDSLQSQYGCDSIVVLILTVHEHYCDTIYAETCDNIPYTQNGFNADTSGVYTQHLETVYGCDSTVTLILTVYPTYIVPLNKEICEGETYIDHGFWLTYSGTFLISSHQSCHGCDSLFVLNLTVNPTYDELIEASICEGDTFSYPGYENLTVWEAGMYRDVIESSTGCDSAKTLILTINPIKRDTIYGSICDNESYNANGFSESEPGIYIDTLTSTAGCDSIVWLYLERREKYEDTTYIEICDGYEYIFGDNIVTETGIYNGQLESIYGCDSLVELHLTVHPVYSDTIYRRICRGSSYIDQDFNESSDGTYSVHYSSIHGCDSIITLVLETVYYNDTITDTICKGLVYDFYGTSLTETGIYTHNITTTEMGCDSIVTLFLQVNHPYIDSIYASICEGDVYDRYGFNATEQGRYEMLYSTVDGCDSIKVLNLTVRSSYNDTITAHICQGEIYTNFGFLADATGLHTRYYHTTLGCDSIITLNLFVHNRAFDTIEATICEGDVYRENNFEESEEGEYKRELQTVYGCDSLVVLNLKVAQNYYDTITKMINEDEYYNSNGFYESKEGIYTQYHISQNGCDSVVVLNLRVNGEADLYVPNTITPQGNIAENKKFYLIPSNEKLVIDDVFIYNRWGELIFRSQYNAEAWDGKYKGKLCQQGAYTYLILYHTTNSSDIRRSRKGTVLVLY